MFITITGSYTSITGTPGAGTVRFTLVPAVRLPGTGIVGSDIRVTLDGAGAFSTPLLATMDPAVQPAGAVYRVDERVNGARREYAVTVPHDAGDPLALSSLPQVES